MHCIVPRLCKCGSGQPSRWLHDAAGIPVDRVCDACEKEKRSRFNPAIFKPGTFYATTGREDLIGLEDDIREDDSLT